MTYKKCASDLQNVFIWHKQVVQPTYKKFLSQSIQNCAYDLQNMRIRPKKVVHPTYKKCAYCTFKKCASDLQKYVHPTYKFVCNGNKENLKVARSTTYWQDLQLLRRSD